MKILAVDDEPLFLEILEIALAEIGHSEFTPAYSAQAALRELEQGKEPFDCILLDIRMPGMDGIALCRAIRAITRYRRAPIMMVTSMAERGHIDAAFAAGATDYLTKPLDPVELKARMGVMERLVFEQMRSTLLEYRAAAVEDRGDLAFALSTPVTILGYDRVIEYLALENYLLSLGRKESYGVSAFAISITNAALIFDAATPVAFMNLLADVASCIDEALRATPALVSYAGNGNFVVVPNGTHGEVDTATIQDEINMGLAGFEGIYLVDRVPLPTVLVGAEVRRNLFSRFRASELLERAIASTWTGGLARPPRSSRIA
ncbi:MAG: response regulator [Rubellimicrobium sp.]|nr:response regulator [Rubellimicrobium sp.]